MTSVIERAARALAKLDAANWDARHFGETPSGQEPEDMRQGYRDQVRAVLQAIREPSGQMVNSGTAEHGDMAGYEAEAVWTAMIDTALNEASRDLT